jgi:hypothetical protein
MNVRPLVVVTDFLNDDLRPEKEVLGDLADAIALNAESGARSSG